MNKKYLKVVLGFLIAALFVVPVLAAPATPEVRVVDLKVLGASSLTDADIVKLARMDVLEKPDLFPPTANFGISIQGCSTAYPTTGLSFPGSLSESVALSGKIEPAYAYRFTSISDPLNPEMSPVAAVVKPDGTVMRIDKSLGMEIDGKSMTSTACLLINPEDIVLVFADTATPSGTTAAGPITGVLGGDDADDDAADDDAADDDAADDDTADDDAADDDAADDDAADDDAADDDADDDDAHDNNGHGNNVGGVDPSNPGQGGGGPTGTNNNTPGGPDTEDPGHQGKGK